MNGKTIVGDYLPLSGGTLTGSLTGTSGAFTSLTVGGNTVITTTQFNPVLTSVNALASDHISTFDGWNTDWKFDLSTTHLYLRSGYG